MKTCTHESNNCVTKSRMIYVNSKLLTFFSNKFQCLSTESKVSYSFVIWNIPLHVGISILNLTAAYKMHSFD